VSDEYDPEHTGPVGGRRRDLPAVPPARPRQERPAHQPTTEIDLSRGFPPVSNETAEIDLSRGWPAPPPPQPQPPRRGGRVLGVDVGTVRVGVAMSDPTGTLASPVETLKRAGDRSDMDRLAALVVEHEVSEVVVGEPRHLSGASGASARDAAAYARELAERIGDDVPVHLVDERLSTVTAASSLRASGRDSREQRSVIDQAAAVVILQHFLDSRRASS
jgi:putative Holliday junction resolvase